MIKSARSGATNVLCRGSYTWNPSFALQFNTTLKRYTHRVRQYSRNALVSVQTRQPKRSLAMRGREGVGVACCSRAAAAARGTDARGAPHCEGPRNKQSVRGHACSCLCLPCRPSARAQHVGTGAQRVTNGCTNFRLSLYRFQLSYIRPKRNSTLGPCSVYKTCHIRISNVHSLLESHLLGSSSGCRAF